MNKKQLADLRRRAKRGEIIPGYNKPCIGYPPSIHGEFLAEMEEGIRNGTVEVVTFNQFYPRRDSRVARKSKNGGGHSRSVMGRVALCVCPRCGLEF